MAELPCDADGICMLCKAPPPDSRVLLCNSCCSPWHMDCLVPPLSSVPAGEWFCPDCNPAPLPEQQQQEQPLNPAPGHDDVVSRIRAIRSDSTLTEQEKARKCQDVMSKTTDKAEEGGGSRVQDSKKHKMLQMFDENLNCIFCMQLADRPVTTPCGHNFCLKCFQRWIGQGKKSCGKCRAAIPAKMASQPRINSALVIAIRMAKSAANPCPNGPPKPHHYVQNQDRPDKCFTTERAKKAGKANAASGKIFVTVPPDHFGPVTAENDPVRGQGVLVGETWEDRLECRQWGAHFPHVAGIAGQSDHGAQSVALSGGYEDDEDHGEWFLYTGSGGRDLSGNKRTNDKQSFDQKFEKSNLALRVSCKRGYPVRVVRSHKEKRSSYAPESGVRYDGIYRIEKCWRRKGIQGFIVCRYLFVRCDNEPAPWTSDENGDRPRPLPKIDELRGAIDVTERKSQPAWDWKEEEGMWGWTTEPPASRKVENGGSGQRNGTRKTLSIGQRLLKEFGCGLCKKVLKLPLSTPCGHNFCKTCLLAFFAGQKNVRERNGVGGRSLRTQKVVKRCPACPGDISDFLINPQVNRQMDDVIQSLNAENESEMDEDVRESSVVEQDPTSDKNEEAAVDLSIQVPRCGDDDKSPVHFDAEIDGDSKSAMDASEREFLELCERYPEYSRELLRSMLLDQEGDCRELESLLNALTKQQKVRGKKQKNGARGDNGKEKSKRGAKMCEEQDGEEGNESMDEPEGTVKESKKNKRKRREDVSEKGQVQQPRSKRSKSISPSSPLQALSDSDS